MRNFCSRHPRIMIRSAFDSPDVQEHFTKFNHATKALKKFLKPKESYIKNFSFYMYSNSKDEVIQICVQIELDFDFFAFLFS